MLCLSSGGVDKLAAEAVSLIQADDATPFTSKLGTICMPLQPACQKLEHEEVEVRGKSDHHPAEAGRGRLDRERDVWQDGVRHGDVPRVASRSDEIWAMDVVHHPFAMGQRCASLGRSSPSDDSFRLSCRSSTSGTGTSLPVLDRTCHPASIHLDQGSEFTSRDLDLWAYTRSVTLVSRPASMLDQRPRNELIKQDRPRSQSRSRIKAC